MDGNSRQLHINPPRRVFPVIKHRVVVQLETGLHAIKVFELDECKTAASGGLVLFGCDADRGWWVFDEVLFDALVVCGVGKVSCGAIRLVIG